IAPRLADHGHDTLSLARQIGLGRDHGQLQLNEADDDTVRGFVEAAKSVHALLPFMCCSLVLLLRCRVSRRLSCGVARILSAEIVPAAKQSRFCRSAKDY